ncbi:hypothetical protein CBR_g8944 [Chara braunii]|uniref:ATP-dependent Clp protease proteolytic subunit n=1 Tax=Chara braunii TaxID=69332 RepID=A0A388KN89_CHABU|nr:hypothetical protein CBR_g8944 [Chara braunii]|eukprot:GBG71526.1 hypothetical protein CBR_g8944 [Chara braunii]
MAVAKNLLRLDSCRFCCRGELTSSSSCSSSSSFSFSSSPSSPPSSTTFPSALCRPTVRAEHASSFWVSAGPRGSSSSTVEIAAGFSTGGNSARRRKKEVRYSSSGGGDGGYGGGSRRTAATRVNVGRKRTQSCPLSRECSMEGSFSSPSSSSSSSLSSSLSSVVLRWRASGRRRPSQQSKAAGKTAAEAVLPVHSGLRIGGKGGGGGLIPDTCHASTSTRLFAAVLDATMAPDRQSNDCGGSEVNQIGGRRGGGRGGGGGGGGCRGQVTMMPIGTPKVPYRTPGEGGWQWVDIWNVLYRERIIFVGQYIDEEFGNQVLATMLYLDSIDSTKPMYLYINSPGGEITPSMALFDTMESIASPVGTLCFGYAYNMACFLLAAGEKGKRAAMPMTRVALQPPAGAARGQADDVRNEANELVRVRKYMYGVLAHKTGHDIEKITKDLRRIKRFDAKEAMEYGLIDRIIRPIRIKKSAPPKEVATSVP